MKKIFNKNILASLLFILIINSQIILTKVNIKRKKIKVSEDPRIKICEETRSYNFDYFTFFVTAISRVSSSFVSQVTNAFEKLISLDKLNDNCKKLIVDSIAIKKMAYLNEKQTYANTLVKQLDQLKEIAFNQGLAAYQIARLEIAYESKKLNRICNALKNIIISKSAKGNSLHFEKIVYFIKRLDGLIYIANKNNNYNNPYITIDQITEHLDDCSILGLLFDECEYQKQLKQMIQSRSYKFNNPNLYILLFQMKSEYIYERENFLQMDAVEESFDCDLLSDTDIHNDICVKSDIILNIKSLWATIKSIPEDGILGKCLDGFIPNFYYGKIFKNLFSALTTTLTEIFGFLIFRGIKFFWNLGVIMYNIFQYTTEQDIKLRSEYLGEIAGASIRMIIDMLSTSLNKKRRLKK